MSHQSYLNQGHTGSNFRVTMLSWDTMTEHTKAVVSSREEADRLVDKYSEQYPHAYFDYVPCL